MVEAAQGQNFALDVDAQRATKLRGHHGAEHGRNQPMRQTALIVLLTQGEPSTCSGRLAGLCDQILTRVA